MEAAAQRSDNYWLDCLVGTAVAAAVEGLALASTMSTENRKKQLSLSAIQAPRWAGKSVDHLLRGPR